MVEQRGNVAAAGSNIKRCLYGGTGRDECQLLAELEHERVVQGRIAFPYLADLRQELHLRKG